MSQKFFATTASRIVVKSNSCKFINKESRDIDVLIMNSENAEQRVKKEMDIFTQNTIKLIDLKIEEVLHHSVSDNLKSVIDYQISSGGKRIRPMLAVLSCLACGGKIEDALYPAAGLEILHNYSLIIDDIIDDSVTRRNRPTMWAKFGRSIAECISNNYIAAAFQAANRSKNPVEISEIFAKTMKILVEGEILDNLFDIKKRKEEIYIVQNRYKEVKLEDYFDMIGKKTAIMTQSCCEVGGLCADAEKSQIDHLKKFGFYIGMAGQIKDDVLDVFGNEEKIGKKVGKDIMQGNRGNIVTLIATKELSGKNRKVFCGILHKDKITDRDIKIAIDLIRKTDSYEKSIKIGRDFIAKAKNELSFLPYGNWNDVLSKFADFIIERDK